MHDPLCSEEARPTPDESFINPLEMLEFLTAKTRSSLRMAGYTILYELGGEQSLLLLV